MYASRSGSDKALKMVAPQLKCANFVSLFILLVLPSVGFSQFIVENLPGYNSSLPSKLETGYISVGDLDEIQLFYYFLESENAPSRDPLVVWLNAGPGCSAFSSLIYEIGPLQFNYSDFNGDLPSLSPNPFSWTKVVNLLLIDSPVGTGFSYSNNSDSYVTSDTLATAHAYKFLRKWLLLHPEFLRNQLYIGGESNSGVVVPLLVEDIINGNEKGLEPKMNLKGYLLGNPYTSLANEINSRIPYAHRILLISDALYKSLEKYCNGSYVDVDPSNTYCLASLEAAGECLNPLYMPEVLEPTCTGFAQKWDVRKWDRTPLYEDPKDFLRLKSQSEDLWCRADFYKLSYLYMNSKETQAALGVREGTVNEWVRCNNNLSYTYDIDSSLANHKNLSQKFLRVLVYSGDQDMVVPYIGTQRWINSLALPVTSKWRPWFIQGQVGGYTTKYSKAHFSLTYATVKGAGHTAPEFKPKEMFDMIKKWFSHYPL